MKRTVARALCASGAMLVAACAPLGTASTLPSPSATAAEWTAVQAQVSRDVVAGRYVAADHALMEFEQRNASTAEALDAEFYRALYKLDPANPGSAPRDAAGLLETFLASPIVSAHRADAIVLRRVAGALDVKLIPVASGVTPAPATPKADDRTKDEELVRLKEELAKANAELDRIKRRLATPKP